MAMAIEPLQVSLPGVVFFCPNCCKIGFIEGSLGIKLREI